MNEALDFEAACRIARAERQSVTFIRRVLTGVDDSPEARRIRALSAEAIARAPACRRIRVVNSRPSFSANGGREFNGSAVSLSVSARSASTAEGPGGSRVHVGVQTP
jgi:hypothetical protein